MIELSPNTGNGFCVAFDDLTALGAIHALWKAGVSVPRDCSVIGFDDIP